MQSFQQILGTTVEKSTGMMNPLCAHECPTCESSRVQHLPEMPGNRGESWFECSSCGDVFVSQGLDALPESPEDILEGFRFSELPPEDLLIVNSLRKRHRLSH